MALPGMKAPPLLTLLATERPPTPPAVDHCPPPEPGVADQAHWPGVVVRTHGCGQVG